MDEGELRQLGHLNTQALDALREARKCGGRGAHIHSCTHTNTHTQSHTQSHAHTHARTVTHTHTHARTHAHTVAHMHARTRTLTRTHTYTHTRREHTHASTLTGTPYTHARTHTYSCTHTHTHTHTHIYCPTHVRTPTCTCTRTPLHTCMRTHLPTRLHTHAHTRASFTFPIFLTPHTPALAFPPPLPSPPLPFLPSPPLLLAAGFPMPWVLRVLGCAAAAGCRVSDALGVLRTLEAMRDDDELQVGTGGWGLCGGNSTFSFFCFASLLPPILTLITPPCPCACLLCMEVSSELTSLS